MISSIKQYKSGKGIVSIDKLIPNELYKQQSYCKESLDLIFDYNLSSDYDFKLLITSYSKIELLDDDNVYKRELIKLWEYQFNLKFSKFWNVYYGITKARIKKAEAFNQSPIDNWDQRLGIEKKLTDPMDFRISLLERSGLSVNTDVDRKDIVSSNGDIIENSTLNAMRSPFLTKSADEFARKKVDSIGNIDMTEKDTEIDQAPDPHLLEFLYGNDDDSKQKKEKIVNKKKIEEIETLVNKEAKKKKKKNREKEVEVEEEVMFDRLATVNLDDFYTYSKPTTYTHEFYTESFKKSMKGPDENENIDIGFFDKHNSLGADEKQNIVVIHEGDSSKYQLAYEVTRRQAISGAPKESSEEKKPIIKTTQPKPKLNEIDAKREALKELRLEVEYKRQLQKLNEKNNKIIKKRREEIIKEEQREQKQRVALNKKAIKEYGKISSIENEIKLNKLIGKKSGIAGKHKAKLRQSHNNKSIDEQRMMVEIDAQLIEIQNTITNMDKSLNKDNND